MRGRLQKRCEGKYLEKAGDLLYTVFCIIQNTPVVFITGRRRNDQVHNSKREDYFDFIVNLCYC